MDWTMLGAVGELAGAAVVGFTVIYLARQVRLGNQMAWAMCSTTCPTSSPCAQRCRRVEPAAGSELERG